MFYLPNRRAQVAQSPALLGGTLDSSWVYTALGTPMFDIDLVNRAYWWNGAIRFDADFDTQGTGMTWDSHGMTPGLTGYLSQTLAALGMTNAATIGTIAASYYFVANGTGNDYAWVVSDNNATNYYGIIVFAAGTANIRVQSGGAPQVSAVITHVAETKFAAGLSWQANNTYTAIDTAAAVLDATCTMPAVAPTELIIGAAWNKAASLELNAIGRIIGYNTNLSAADLQTATTYLYGLQT